MATYSESLSKVVRNPSGFLPIAMSLSATALVLAVVLVEGSKERPLTCSSS